MKNKSMKMFISEIEELNRKIEGNSNATQAIEISILEGPFEASAFSAGVAYLNEELGKLSRELAELIESYKHKEE